MNILWQVKEVSMKTKNSVSPTVSSEKQKYQQHKKWSAVARAEEVSEDERQSVKYFTWEATMDMSTCETGIPGMTTIVNCGLGC